MSATPPANEESRTGGEQGFPFGSSLDERIIARKRGEAMPEDRHVMALVKGNERYVFVYTTPYRAEVLKTLGRFASDPSIAFSWYDAAVLARKVRESCPVNECQGR